jgi:UDP-N-acetylmuramoyl-L-alanyl-D-glutamate--2,6-diaminopimelate ligase
VPLIVAPKVRQALGYALDVLHGSPSASLHVLGVTGTDGKTSVCEFIGQLLMMTGKSCGVIGTLGAHLGDQILAPAQMTTPDTTDLHARLAHMGKLRADAVALEVSSHALKQERVAGVHFETAVFTNLSEEHLDYHQNRKDYLRSKTLLFEKEGLGRCVLNADDPCSAYIAERASAECIYYGVNGSVRHEGATESPALRADVYAENARFDQEGIHALIKTPWGDGELHAPLFGHFNLLNILAALSAIGGRDIPIDKALEGVTQLQAPRGRMQFVDNDLGLSIVVDFAHTANGMKQSLSGARTLCKRRLWCVFGCGGERDTSKRARMGHYAQHLADRIILTNDNPRAEPSEKIIDDILSGMDKPHSKVEILPDRAHAIMHALRSADSGDMVLIAGKGHESHMETADGYIPFNDVDQARRCLDKIGSALS